MKNYLILTSMILCLILSCKQKKLNNEVVINVKDSIETSISKKEIKTINQKPYFVGSGSEPFWSLEIFSDSIVYRTPTNVVRMPNVKPILAQDSNVKRYQIETESSKMAIQITQKECANDMSGEISPYAVSIEKKQNTETVYETLEGCGKYITDYRLHDIWVLESLNGREITNKDFSQEFPNIEIYSAQNTFLGFAGCNQMNGTIFFEKDLLRFSNLVTTERICGPANKEYEFLRALQSSIRYSIENNRLTLSNPSENLIIFKKVD
ncbi:META domain-containing protein [Bizionia arctica]|uniref:DUF306 domain-containing protein n=1 Tax=Bizionia arctica TaxID=1495645 RepID=A0A917GB96_9FLAO|nr:META domain-containing protein [Bizionia arctica]GGG34230.1 hypothetical protein GCM10010976_02440 [Bizionia arctica]